MHTITRRELQQLIKADPAPILVEALPAPFYWKAHLPGAINIPHTDVAALAPTLIPDRHARIVTYCLNLACQNAEIAARTLEALGYSDVRVYAAGKQDWLDAGLDIEKGGFKPIATANEEPPLALVSCTLDEKELAARSAEYQRTLFSAARERRELADGYAFRFEGDDQWRTRIESFVDEERRCCSFFQIDVSYEAGLGPIWLTLTGPQGTKSFIETTFDVGHGVVIRR